jgi:fibronectin-binding autotransporter adhesin
LEVLENRRMLATNITQYHVDAQSTGADLTETQLTSSNVNAADFGQLYNTPLDGQVYAEPLVVTNVTISAGPNTIGTPGPYNSVVFVATENDSLYAINAANGDILWQRTFLDTTNPNDALPGATSVTTIPSADTGSSDINPEIGITSTPVIDLSTNVIYVLPATEETVGGQGYYVQRLHAINISDGTDAAPSFVIGTTTGSDENVNDTPIYVNGTGDGNVNGVVQFNALREGQRAALTLVNGEVYAAWASHGDNGPYHGWVVEWNVTNLSTQGMVLSGVLCTDPNGGEGGIWGGTLSFDPDESVDGQPDFYFETGNGDPRGGPPPLNAEGFPSDDDYYESLVKVVDDPTTTASDQNSNGWGMQIVDYFTPYNVNALDDADEDFGSGGCLILPDSAGIPGYPHLMVAAGKEGTIYLIDRDNMGKFNVNDDNVLNSVYNPSTGVTTPPVLINGSLSTPAYYDGTIYWVSGYSSNAWSFVVAPNPDPDAPTVPVATLEPTSETANNNFGYVPGSVMVSANGEEDSDGAVVWIVDRNNSELDAYSALSLNTELWSSGQSSIATVKFAVPTIANGQVFVGTQDSLQVFGLTGASTPTQVPNAPANLSAQALSGSSVELDWTDSTVSPNFATNYAILESTDDSNFTTVANAGQESTSYTVTGLNPSTTYYFEIVGSNSAGSSGPSNTASAMTTNQTGLTPTSPQGLGATPAGGSSAYLTWTNTATNETGFVLTRATDSLFTQNVVTEALASAPYYYTDDAPGLSPGNTYYYKLQATNSSGLSSSSNTASVTIPNVPAAATDAVAVVSGTSVTVGWIDNAGPYALGYQVYRSVDGGPYSILVDLPETSDEPPTPYSYTDTDDVVFGNTYSYEIQAENIAGFSAPAYATASDLGSATLSLDDAGDLSYTAAPGSPDRLVVNLANGIYTLTDTAVTIVATGTGTGYVSGAGTSSVAIPAADVNNMTLATSDVLNDDITILNDAAPITIAADSGGGDPDITLGDPTNNDTTISGDITNLSNGTISISGSGATDITGMIDGDGSGGLSITGSGSVSISGDVNLGYGNLTDSGSGAALVSGNISGNSDTAPGLLEGQLNADIDTTSQPNPAYGEDVVLSPVMGETFTDSPASSIQPTSDHAWASPDEWVYQGLIYVAPSVDDPTHGYLSFWGYEDDNSSLSIDGNQLWSSTDFDGGNHVEVTLTPGWHTIDIRIASSSSTAGGLIPDEEAPGEGFLYRVDTGPNDPLADSTNIADYVVPTDNGSGNLFRIGGDPGGVIINGSGVLTLSGNNTYYGPTSVDSGELVAASNGAMSAANGSVVVSGGVLALPASGGVTLSSDEAITITGTGAVENLGGSNAITGPITVSGLATIGCDAGTLSVSGDISCQGSSGVTLAGAGVINIAGNINLGPAGNLIDAGSGTATISGTISGTATSGSGLVQGLIGDYFNLTAAQDLIQPAATSNPAWLGNQTPAVTAPLIGPIDFPDIADNGFADSVGDPAYYNLGGGNNNNVEARWYGDIMIPGTGTTPVPINFATTSDDGSMLYIDGNAVVDNNNFQAVTQATGMVNLTPGLHTIDVEYYQGGGAAIMDAQWDSTGGNNFVDIPNSAFLSTQAVNGLEMTGDGTLTLTKTNSYLGSTTIDAGTLVVMANGAMGSATATGIVVSAGGALALSGGVNYTTAEPITIDGTGPAGDGAIENISGTNAFAPFITLSGTASIGSDAGAITLGGNISAGSSTLTVVGAGTTTINGNIICQGGSVNLASSGAINIAGNINLGSTGNLVDAGSGSATISGTISGTASSGLAQLPGVIGTYFNLPASQDLIQPADPSNSAWLGNQTPAVTAPLIGPIDFPDIADNGFADSVGDPAYYNLGAGNNNNVEARWYGDIMIPGTGTTPVPINFATTSDDGSMLYIDGNAVVDNNNLQAATQATGLVSLTPGLHTIDVEYYQAGGAAVMDAQWDPTGGDNFVDIPNSAFSTVEAVNGLTMTGAGTLTLTQTNSYLGSTTIDAGTLVVTANGAMGPATATGIVVNAGGALAFTGGLNYTTAEPITISGAGPAGNGAIENISGTNTFAAPITLSGTASIGSDAGTMTLSGAISGMATDDELSKTGAGTLTLSNSNAYSGATTVNAGELLVNGSVLDSAITVNSGGTLGGDGSVPAATVQSGGFLSSGDSPGTLAATSLSLATGAAFIEQLGGTTAGSQYDQTVIPAGGSVALGGATLNISFLGGFLPAVGQQFILIDNESGSSVVGTFSQGSTFTSNDYVFGINYTGGAGHDVVLTVLGQTETATKLSSLTTPGAAPDTSLFGQSVTFTATVKAGTPASGTPAGTVIFEDGSTVLGTVSLSQGSASWATSTLGVGMHTITAHFMGTDGWQTSVDSLTQTVNRDPTTTSIASSPGAPVSGQSLTFTATVGAIAPGVGTPTGTVAFYVDGAQVGTSALEVVNGVPTAIFQDAGLSAGSHTIAAAYSGDPTFAAGTLVSSNLIVSPSQSTGGGSPGGPPNGSTGAPTAPQLTQVTRHVLHRTRTTVVLQFSEALDPTPAVNLKNYAILPARPHGQRLKILSAVYDPVAWTVTLRTRQTINPHLRYELKVNGVAPLGLISASGVYLAGNGVAGTSAVFIFK